MRRESRTPQDRAQGDDVGSSQPSPPGERGRPHAGQDDSGDCRQIEEQPRTTRVPVRPLHDRNAENEAEKCPSPYPHGS